MPRPVDLYVHKIGVPRAPPVYDIPVRALSVSMADLSRSRGNGSSKSHAHAPVAGVRKGTPMTVLTVGDARCSWPASRCFRPYRTGPFPDATTCSPIIRILVRV